jgi:two-component system sensor histidine kinase BarA
VLKNASTSQPEKRSSIRTKIVALVLVGIAITTLLITAASGWREAERFAEAKRAEIEGTAFVLASAVADTVSAKDRMGVMKVLRAIGRIPAFKYARVDDETGRTIAELGAAVTLVESADLPILLRSTLETSVPVVKQGRPIGTVTVLVNTQELRQRLIDSSFTGLIAALLSAALGIAVAFRMQDRITRPLRQLTETMANIQKTNNFSTIVDHRANDETGILVEAFNGMMLQIRQRDDRLSRHREQLEHKVEERTHDLKIAKDTAEEANAAKSDFLATMSHEIRTPMNGMLVMAELLASANLTDKHRRYADVVVKSGQSLLTIINDILDFSKIESGKMELECIDLDPSTVVDDVLNLFWDKASSKGLDLAGYVARDVPQSIMGDPVRLNQILSNLVNNALKFTEQGYVKVEVEMVQEPGGAGDPGLRFAVSDTGIGIAQDKLATVFESFSQADQTTTRRFGGTGLGLAICRRLVGAMDGEITVSSVEGQGSEFSFTIHSPASTRSAECVTPNASGLLGKAVVAVASSATSQAIARYLVDLGIDAKEVSASTLGSGDVREAQLVLADPDAVASLTADAERQAAAPFVICVSQLGDIGTDELIASERAHDVVMRPVSRTGIIELISRLENGAPRGRSILERRESQKLPAYPGAKVLVADDSPVNREVVSEALRQMHVHPDAVEDGLAAVRAAEQKHYDLIFMDCSMPEMDGFEATRRIREMEIGTGQHVPIVALTAHAAGVRADEWQQAGMDDYLTKPFRIIDLVETFAKYFPEEVSQTVMDTPSIPAAVDNRPADSQADLDQLPVIDEKVLCEAIGCEAGEGGELALRVLALFEEHGPPSLLKLAETAQTQGSEQIGDAAHALKSMCRNIGAVRLGEACDQLENEAKDGHIENVMLQLARLQAELVAVLDRIKQIQSARQQPNKVASLEMRHPR